MLFPSTLYAHMTSDPGLEAALYRSYNRYVGRQCKTAPKRLRWAGLLPMRERTKRSPLSMRCRNWVRRRRWYLEP